jgi:alpha-beta hydrolase superfamily lysophospholipase
LAETAATCTLETFQAGDGYRWRYRRYAPASSPRAHVICIHGIQSHGGWYMHSCESLSQAGFLVDFLDRRGSGLNEEGRGDAPGFRRLLDDIAEFIRATRNSGHALPVFLVAISWGAKLGVALQRRHPSLVDGLVFVCPGIFPKVRPKLKQRLAILWARLTAPARRFPIPLNDPELFTATPRWQQFLRDDKLALHEGTARLLIESVRLDGYVRWNPAYVTAPTLVFLAGQDRIIDNERTRRFIERFSAKDKQIIEYPEAHHTLEFEPDPSRFIGDLRRWLDAHIPKSTL